MKGKKEEEKHERRIKYTRSAVHTISSLHSVRAQNSNAGSGCMVSLDLDRCLQKTFFFFFSSSGRRLRPLVEPTCTWLVSF